MICHIGGRLVATANPIIMQNANIQSFTPPPAKICKAAEILPLSIKYYIFYLGKNRFIQRWLLLQMTWDEAGVALRISKSHTSVYNTYFYKIEFL
jgi:hypothetical protein